MIRTDFFGDREFDMLLALIHPFDATFPAIHIHTDRLLYEIANALSNGGADETFEEFCLTSAKARKIRGEVIFHPKSEIIFLFKPLVKLVTLVALQFSDMDSTTDRFIYELGLVLGDGSCSQSFEEFHLEHRLIRSAFNCKVRGVG